jgi:hypothetical protein
VLACRSCDGSLGSNKPSPAYDHGFDAVTSFSVLPITAIPSTWEGNHIRTDMVLTKDLQWPVQGWFPFVNESIDTLLSCCHRVFHVDQTKSGIEVIRDPRLGLFQSPFQFDRFASARLLPDRCMLFTAMAGVPDFSAMSRSCSSMLARVRASLSRLLRISLGTLRFDR